MNKHNLFPIRQVFFALLIACAFSACSTEPDLLGLNLTPLGDRLNGLYTDTSTVVAYNTPIDTLRTSVLPGYTASSYTSILWGAMYDSTFGKVEANFATQLWLSSLNPTIGANTFADSVILQLPYQALFGDSLAAQTINVYELGESLRGDIPYYSDHFITPSPSSLLCSQTFVPDVKDSVTINGVKYQPMLRLKLSNTFGNKIINGGAHLATQEAFRAYIKGLYITATPKNNINEGSIVTFDLTGSNAGLQIFYKAPSDSGSISLYVNGSSSQRFNTFNFHNYQYADPLFKAQFFSKDTLKGRQKLFLSGMSPSDIKITFPYILKYKEKQRAGFNQAFLVIDAPYATATHYPPAQLALYKVYKDGLRYSVEDQASGTAGEISGTYDTLRKQYRFAITQYLQNILKTGKQDYYLMLTTGTPGKLSQDLVIPGTMAGKKRLRLELIYTTQK
ncbi:MAG: DUF4270 domain-containing protein [Bacteroidota bacterium]|nr:DUF4270 domain-containing protein [Bacteroidota bacterium]